MGLTKTLTLCGALGLLASCATPNIDGCAGWRPVTASEASAEWLAANDPATLKAMIGHQEFGRAQGCW